MHFLLNFRMTQFATQPSPFWVFHRSPLSNRKFNQSFEQPSFQITMLSPNVILWAIATLEKVEIEFSYVPWKWFLFLPISLDIGNFVQTFAIKLEMFC